MLIMPTVCEPFYGVVENRDDPKQLGRVQVRVIGLHSHKRVQDDADGIPVEDLPWFNVMLSSESASMDGVGGPVTGLLNGSHVFGFLLDKYKTNGIVLGSIGGYFAEIPNSDEGFSDPNGEYPSRTGSTVHNLNVGGSAGYNDDFNIEQDGSTVLGLPPAGLEGTDTPSDSLYSTSLITKILSHEEGRKTKIYADVRGWSIGVGHLCIHTGSKPQGIQQLNAQIGRSTGGVITSSEIDALFKSDLAKVRSNVKSHGLISRAYAVANGPRRIALECMAFQMGIGGLAGFTTALNYMIQQKWDLAASSMMNSLWARQTAARAARVARIIKLGNLSPYGITGQPTVAKQAKVASLVMPTSTSNNFTSFQLIEPKTIEMALSLDDIVDLDDLPDVVIPSFPSFTQPKPKIKPNGDVNSVEESFWSGESTDDNTALFQQAPSNYRGQYPYVKTKVSESGMVEEVDDTPGNERFRKVYSTGGYTEVNSQGTRTEKSANDFYQMSERDRNIYVGRDYNVNVGGNETYYNLGNKLKQIDGNESLSVVGNQTVSIQGNQDISVQSNRTLKVQGDDVIEITGTGTIKVTGAVTVICEADATVQVQGNADLSVQGNYTASVQGNYMLNVQGNINQVASGSITTSASGAYNISGSEINMD